MAEGYQKRGLNPGGDAILDERREAGNDACHDRSRPHESPVAGILGNVVNSDASCFLDHAASHATKGGTHHPHDPSLVRESKDQGDRKLACIRPRFPQTKDLVDSPQKRSKQPQAEDQSGGSSLFLQTLVDLAQLGYTFVALLFPLGQFRGIQRQPIPPTQEDEKRRTW